MAAQCNQSNSFARGGPGGLEHDSTRADLHGPLVMFDDEELCDWLMDCIGDGSERFLCAIAEAAAAANAQDYLLLRPALLSLRRKYDAKHATRASAKFDPPVE